MFVTLEILKQLGACDQDIRYIEHFYPNGAEMIDIIRDRHISKEFLHWGRQHLASNEEELTAYCEACRIVGCEGFWYSQDIEDSKYVVKSKNVKHSTSVFESEDILSCADVVGSDNIELSNQVFQSSIVDNCKKIYRGSNITGSTNICNSTMVANSKSVIDSYNVFDSSEIVKCVSVSECHFCTDCENLKNSMFCYGFGNAEYCIFNMPIDKNRYEMISKQYNKFLTELLDFIREWPENIATNRHGAPTKKFDDWYHPISEKFWKWVRTLPGYDPILLYNITMLPNILLDSQEARK